MLTIKEKIAYGMGDMASNIIFQTVMMFLLLFYTDVMGLNPAAVGTMFLLVRVVDAVTDPLMGAAADRTRTRFGQFRPYLLWLAIPFALVSLMAFTTPELDDTGKLIYAYCTYTLLMLIYTAINIPYCALGAVLTDKPQERVSVQSYRFVFGMLGGLVIAAGTLPLVEYFGKGDTAYGYQVTMALMGTLGAILFLLCFLGTKERVEAKPHKQQWQLGGNLKLLWRNDQWRVLAGVGIFLLSGQVLRSSLAVYYVKDYLGQPDMVTSFVTAGMLFSILGCAVSSPLAKKVCKVKAYIGLQLIAAVICCLSFFVAPEQVTLAFVMFCLWSFFLQMATPLLWAKMADVIDYGEYKTGERLTGLVYASVVFFIKMGIAVGGALAGWLLAIYGYQAGLSVLEETRRGILLSFTVYSALGSFIVAGIMSFYRLNRQKVESIHQQLAASPARVN